MNLSYFISKRISLEQKQGFSSAIHKIAVISIGVGLAAVLISFLVMLGFQQTVKDKVYSFSGHLVITKFTMNNSPEEQPMNYHIAVYDNEEQLLLQYINEKQYSLESQKDLIFEILSKDYLKKILNNAGEFRARVYSPLKVIHTGIGQALSSDKSSAYALSGINVGHLINEQPAVCSNTGCYTKAKERLIEDIPCALAKSLGRSTLEKAPLEWKVDGRDVKVFDGTTLNLKDTKANNAQYPKHSNQKRDVGYPQLRMLAVCSLSTGCVLDYALEATKGKGTGEVTLLRSLLGCFNEHDIALGDALFCNFFLVHDLMKKKVDVVIPGQVQRRYHFNEGTVLGPKDHSTQWSKPRRPKWMSKEEYDGYDKTIDIREFEANGIVYMTTLKDASMYPKNIVHALYKRRWEVELHIRSIKTHMGMDRLSAQTPGMVRKEIAFHLLAYNIIRDIMVDGCIQEGALPTHISFKAALQLIGQLNPHFSSIPKNKKNKLYVQMLSIIVKNKVGKRPGRVEPRAIRKKTQRFPTLKADRKLLIDKLKRDREQWLFNNDAA